MAYTEVDEKQLVRAYQAGDERAFDDIVRTQWKALFAHALRRLHDPESAEDAVQDTLLRAYRALPSFSGDLALRAWLHRILTNVCYDEGNRRRRHAGLVERVQAEPIEVMPDAAEEAVLHDTVRVMASALQDLPDSYREALVLRYVDGLSFREVAEVTGISEENARARVHRGRQALNKVLSRLAVMAGFLIPGLRRAQQTAAPETTSAASADHVSIVTQLTSHAMNAAPAVSRIAAEASALPSGKSALLTGAIAAAAAVTVSGAAYTVHEVTQPPRKPPAAVAAPFTDKPGTTTSTTVAKAAGAAAGQATDVIGGAIDAPTTSTTETTLPRSATHPFERGTDATDATTTTTPAPTTTVPPAGQPSGTLTGTALQATQNGPNVDVDGSITTSSGVTVKLTGRMSFYDDGTVSGELTVTTADGVAHALRYRGTSVASDDASTHKFTGRFRLADGSALGLPDAGDVVSGSLHVAGSAADLSLALQGTDS